MLGGHYRSVPEPWPGSWSLGGMEFSIWRGFIIVTTIAVIAGSWLLLTRTAFGLRIRGSLENPMLARACGISTDALYAATFAFGAALAGLAGALIVPVYQLSADIGLRFLVQGFLSVMLGGVGTFEGPIRRRRGDRRARRRAALGGPAGARRPARLRDRIVIVKFRPQGFIAGARR